MWEKVAGSLLDLCHKQYFLILTPLLTTHFFIIFKYSSAPEKV